MLDFQHSPILSPNYLKCKLPSAPTIMTRSNFATTTKKCLSARPKPQTHSVNLEAIPELVPYISKEKINLHSHFYITTNGSAVSMQKKNLNPSWLKPQDFNNNSFLSGIFPLT